MGTLFAVIGAVLVAVGAIAGVWYVKVRRAYENRLRSEVRDILQEYMPLNEDVEENDAEDTML